MGRPLSMLVNTTLDERADEKEAEWKRPDPAGLAAELLPRSRGIPTRPYGALEPSLLDITAEGRVGGASALFVGLSGGSGISGYKKSPVKGFPRVRSTSPLTLYCRCPSAVRDDGPKGEVVVVVGVRGFCNGVVDVACVLLKE